MKQTLITSITLFLLSTVANAQGYYEKFKQLSAEEDSTGQRQLLEEWAKKNTNEPEFYTCYFNYYVRKSKTEGIRIGNNPGDGDHFAISDSANQVVGYLYGETNYDPKSINLGFEMIDKGISKFPNRLDMRFGKIYMLGQIGNYDGFTDEITKSIDFSTRNKNKWLWTLNEPVKEPQEFLLGNVQSYVAELFEHGDVQSKNIRRIAETTLKHYPNHVMSLSNLAISYILENDYAKALNPLLTAEKKAPKDPIVLSNIAHVYLTLEDKKKAAQYYEKVLKFGDDDTRQFAEEQLKLLKEETGE